MVFPSYIIIIEIIYLEVRQTPHVHVHMVYVRVLTVPPIALGAWSMALVLWQPPEYYYYLSLQCLHIYLHTGVQTRTCASFAGDKRT